MATKKAKKTVRGPQLALPLKAKRAPKRKGAEKDGNPFFALRCPAGLLRAFRAHARKVKKPATVMVREHMAKVTGFKLAVGHD